MKKKESVAIILVTYNGTEITLQCLTSLQSLAYKNFSVYLIDNASSKEERESLKNRVSKISMDITLIESDVNLGFAGGNNLGIKKALADGFELFWLLNNDTEIEPDSLERLVAASRDEQTGVVGSKIYYFGTRKLWFAGADINMNTGMALVRGKDEIDVGQYDAAYAPGYITGCSMLIKRAVIMQVGYLVEDYFMYYEDSDYCMRVKKAGWNMLYEPASVVHHKVGMSSNNYENPVISYYVTRNRFSIVRRHGSFLQKWCALSYMCYRSAKNIYIALFRKDKKIERITMIILGFFHGLIGEMGKL